VWDDLEDRSPTWADQERILRSAQDEARAFSQVPPERRTARLQQRLNAAWRAYHRACRPASLQCWRGEETRNARRRVREMRRGGDLPDVIYRDDDEDSWLPTRERLQMHMIDRAEFDAWPARLPVVPSEASRTAAPPRGDLALRADRSPRLEELRLCRAITKAATADLAVARAWHHIRKQAAQMRWERTQQHQEQDTSVQAEHRR
jgi:hypothetical protein